MNWHLLLSLLLWHLALQGLLLVSPLHLDGWEKKLGWVGIDRTLDKLDVAWHLDRLPEQTNLFNLF